MNIRTRRRGRRSLAAILAAMLMASVLAVVAGSPAQAANTSSEALVDHDDDAATAMVREFGGRDRYDTSLSLAKNFAEGKGGLGTVPVAFIASGFSLVVAVSVSGFAGFSDAPVLLTPSDTLRKNVADFIEDYGVGTIHVLGGSGAVSDAVLEEIEALANEPTVTRIEGIDRYETAANAAMGLGDGTPWCGGEDAAAILVNGGDVSLAEAMMVGPVAFRMRLPVLMTAVDELPTATVDFIEDKDIEHVVIVGSTDSVSEDVANAVRDAGVNTVERIGGDTPAATSVELAKLATGDDCSDGLGLVSDDTVALVHRDALPDGVSAAPVLAGNSTFAEGVLVPILVVGDTLPASVRDYLAATPQADDAGKKVNLSIVAIGGTSAVSASVMEAALAAAASADALTVQIGNGGYSTGGNADGVAADDGVLQIDAVDVNKDSKVDGNDPPQVGEDKIILYFSDNVKGDSNNDTPPHQLTAAIRDILEVNGAPARIVVVRQDPDASAACDADKVVVTLENPLKAGDTISVVGGAKLGPEGDERTVGSASRTVAAKPVDRTRPSVSVILIAGQTTATITTDEEDVAAFPMVDFKDADGVTPLEPTLTPEDGSFVLTFTPALEAGDRITIPRGAVVDEAGNESLQRSFTAIKAQASPRITSVLLSNLNHSEHATIAVPISLTGGDGEAAFSEIGLLNPDDVRADMWLVAKGDGAAAGAAGNDWSVTFDRTSTYSADKDLDIDVRVNTRDQSVFVRFNNGKAKFADLKAALEGNSAFDALFEVVVDPDPATITGDNEGKCGTAANTSLQITRTDDGNPGASGTGLDRGGLTSTAELVGGETKVAIQVTFNGYVSAIIDDGLLTDVLKDTLDRAVKAGATDDSAQSAAVTDLTNLRRVLKLDRTSLEGDQDAAPPVLGTQKFSDPGTTVTYMATADKAVFLPQPRDLVATEGALIGRDSDDGPPLVEAITAIPGVATGYVVVPPDEDVAGAADPEMNGPSQVRIARSSSVDAPK